MYERGQTTKCATVARLCQAAAESEPTMISQCIPLELLSEIKVLAFQQNDSRIIFGGSFTSGADVEAFFEAENKRLNDGRQRWREFFSSQSISD